MIKFLRCLFKFNFLPVIKRAKPDQGSYSPNSSNVIHERFTCITFYIIVKQNPFDVTVKTKLVELKSKFNTDLRRLSNKIIAGIERSELQGMHLIAQNKTQYDRSFSPLGTVHVKKNVIPLFFFPLY